MNDKNMIDNCYYPINFDSNFYEIDKTIESMDKLADYDLVGLSFMYNFCNN